jgi:argonaute-like protein implicated in RNA metabolism and viral defense
MDSFKSTMGYSRKLSYAVSIIRNKLHNLSEREPQPQVVIVSLPHELDELTPQTWTEYGRPILRKNLQEIADQSSQTTIGEYDTELSSRESSDDFSYSSLYRAVKIEAMKLGIPTQFMQLRTLELKGVEDPNIVAWNLAVGLYYKAGGHPWRLEKSLHGTCYVGISFYVARDDLVRSSMAQVFSHTGEGLVLKGSKIEDTKSNRTPRLNEDDAKWLMKEILSTYKRQMGTLPSRVVVHKTSKFSDEELEGLKSQMNDIDQYDFVTIQKSFLRLFRIGKQPPIRGTMFSTADECTHLYTRGFVPIHGRFWGGSSPIPIMIREHHGDSPRITICNEILGLTKMNWNSSNYCSDFPITLVFSERVGDLLGDMDSDMMPQSRYLYYM